MEKEIEKVTLEMQTAFVKYEPPGQFREGMSFASFIGQVRTAFYAGWLARERGILIMAEREETNFGEAFRRIHDGSFYDDYDYAAGPGLRILREADAAMTKFCDRVERREIRSWRTYAEFCKILGREPRQ